MNAIKTLAGGFALAAIWLLMALMYCAMTAIPLAIGLTIIALFGRAIGAF